MIDCALPEEIEILSILPPKDRETVFQLAAQQNHCQTLEEWLNYLKSFINNWRFSNENV